MSWGRPRRVIAKVEHHLGELFPRVASSSPRSRGRSERRPLLQPPWDGRAMDQGGQRSHPLDAPLLPPLPSQRGPAAPRGDRLQPRQSAAPAGSARRHPELAPHEPPTAALQDRRAADPACAVLRAPACRKSLDREPLSADHRAHRATRVAPHVSESPHEDRGP